MGRLRSGYDAAAALGVRSGLHQPQFSQRNAVLMYHSVPEPSAVRPETSDIPPAELRRHLEYYTREYEVVDLPAVLEGGGEKRIALTFDDGYRDFYTNVRPLLHEFDVPATVFVVSGFLDDQLPRERVMNTGCRYDVLTSEQVTDLLDDPLVTVGNHSRTHHDLGRHDDRDLIEPEVVGAKPDLEERFGATIDRFSYPNGRYNETTLEVVAESHDIAVMDESLRPVLGEENPMLVPRVDGGLPFPQIKWRLSDSNGELIRLARHIVDGIE